MQGKRILSLALFWVSGCLASAVHAEIAIVVHPSNGVADVSPSQVANIFLGKAASFPSGDKAEAIDQEKGEDPRDEFYSKVARKNPSQLNAYWSRLIFTGKGQPPKAVFDDEEVKEHVAANPTAVGYIAKESADDSVKVILTVP